MYRIQIRKELNAWRVKQASGDDIEIRRRCAMIVGIILSVGMVMYVGAVIDMEDVVSASK